MAAEICLMEAENGSARTARREMQWVALRARDVELHPIARILDKRIRLRGRFAQPLERLEFVRIQFRAVAMQAIERKCS